MQGMRTAVQCSGDGLGTGYNQKQCGAADISRIVQPATLLVRASEKGPQVVADLYTVPEGLINMGGKRRKVAKAFTAKKKAPTVSLHNFASVTISNQSMVLQFVILDASKRVGDGYQEKGGDATRVGGADSSLRT